MSRCPTCASEIPDGESSCPTCETAADDAGATGSVAGPGADMTENPTPTPEPAPSSPSAVGLLSSAEGDNGGYTPGTILAGRYRIVGLLGRGGMGQVYRADDLTLGQPVALKLLPDKLAQDASRLERFRSEVRVSRKVSHANVCRVHDIGEADGRVFLSMELVDGGDLSSLLKKVGRLPADRGLEIARQLCAGLAAAHDRGVLHRDLKPANVMIDSEGTVHIADFGLAGLAGGFAAGEIRSGTPAYMAPETLAGQEVTQQSDLYALGLVLYELFTGRRAFAGHSMQEYLSKHQNDTPTLPSEIVAGLDPAIEDVVLKCLAKQPEDRPANALQVAMMLPGGDPLAAMLAAGETPSPELIAQAGEDGIVTPGRAWLLFGAVVLLLVVAAVLDQSRHLLALVPLERAPAVQLDRALEALSGLGVEVPAGDVKFGFSTDQGLVRELERKGVTADERAGLVAGDIEPVQFWLRAAPAALVNYRPSGRVAPTRPPHEQPGEVFAWFDSRGRLRALEVVPDELLDPRGSSIGPPSHDDWTRVFAITGLDPVAFQTTDALWSPTQHVDQVTAFRRTSTVASSEITRLEAGTLGGRITYVRTVRGFEDAAGQEPETSRASTASQTFEVVLILAVLAGGSLLAYRNVRLGRVDSRGAVSVAAIIVGLNMIAWLLSADHAFGAGTEFPLFVLAVGDALFAGGFVWLLYMALEPELRRHWPSRLISWERMLTSRLHDPLVGRHVLVGLLLGSALLAMMSLIGFVVWNWHEASSEVLASGVALISSSTLIVATIMEQLAQAIFSGLFITVLVLLARLVLRRTWAAVLLFSVIFVGLNALQGEPWYVSAAIATVILVGVMFALLRFGLLTLMVTLLALNLFQAVPLNLSLSGWHGVPTTLPLLAVALLAFAAFAAAVGKQPWFPVE